jgi:hypothetical protein
MSPLVTDCVCDMIEITSLSGHVAEDVARGQTQHSQP